NIFRLQKDVALAIAKEINVSLTPTEKRRIAAAPKVNPDAYDLCLQAGRKLGNMTTKNLDLAIELSNRASAIDPNSPLPYTLLSRAYWQCGIVGHGDSGENYRKQRTTARAALRIDEYSAGANSALGWAALSFEWDWKEAEF